MSIIESVRALVQGCPFLSDFSGGVQVDYTDQSAASNYGIFPTGHILLSLDMAGNARWQYDFVLQAVEFTAEDENRLQNCAFIERFCHWIAGRNFALPDLGEGLDAESLTAQNGQFVDVSEDGTAGTYQILCNLIYEKEK